MNTCTRSMRFGSVDTQFFVGCTIPGMSGEACTLHVSRTVPGRLQSFEVVRNKPFPSTDAAYKWAYEHGYLQDYYHRVWCPIHRMRHISGSWIDARGYMHITFTPWCREQQKAA